MTDFPTAHNADRPVLIIGAAGVDLIGRLKGNLQEGTSNPALIRTSFGGVARNVAENLARLGQPVTLLTCVGADQIGDQLLEYTAEPGVDTRWVARSAQHPTGTYLAVIGRSGELQFALDDMRVIDELSADFLRAHYQLFKGAAALFVDANIPPKALRAAFFLARRARLPVYADPTSASLAKRLQPFLARLQAITPNSAEAAALGGGNFPTGDHEQAVRAAKHLVAQGVGLAIITLAEFGVCYATARTSGHIPAIRTEIVDPTGAGDALTAAVIFALLNEIPVDEAIRLGVSAASLTLRNLGSVVPDLSLEKLYDQLVI